MRIIDTQHDFYDYLQDSTDTLVFDRRNSFLITKEYLCSSITSIDTNRYTRRSHYFYLVTTYKFLLLQCGATYWLILMNIIDYESNRIKNYELELLSTWKNYNKPRTTIKLSEIEFYTHYFNHNTEMHSEILNHIKDLQDAIDNNDIRREHILSVYKQSRDHKQGFIYETKDMPLLNACGIKDIVDPVDIFTAIEEHFSLEKTEAERIEPIGATNNDKIVIHGFDTKVSFRGK